MPNVSSSLSQKLLRHHGEAQRRVGGRQEGGWALAEAAPGAAQGRAQPR